MGIDDEPEHKIHDGFLWTPLRSAIYQLQILNQFISMYEKAQFKIKHCDLFKTCPLIAVFS